MVLPGATGSHVEIIGTEVQREAYTIESISEQVFVCWLKNFSP
jgi:hypothetical protein